MIGKTVSHYKILEKLGEGGMGVVYKAEDTRLRRTVALKFLPSVVTRDLRAKERFIQEAQAASAIDHPNICTIHEIDTTDDGRMFIAMACYEGETVKERIGRGQLGWEDAVNTALSVGRGLAKTHALGIVHRDIKPANIYVTREGQVKILDFGLAKLAGQTGLTTGGMALGTVAYMSPEQARGDRVDHRTDIWSLGVVMYEMLTGERPFKGDYEPAVMYSIVNESPVRIASLAPRVPRDLERIVDRMLEKEPAKRYQSIQAVVLDLRSILVPDAPLRRRVKSIAVLPFVDLSPGKDNEYFSDGLSEEIITGLSKVEDLRVISRSSAMKFKGTSKRIVTIARELGVQYVLEGSVRKAGDNLRITAQLIDATSDVHLWARMYRGTLSDVFDIQERVAHSIVNALRVTLKPLERTRLAERPVDNVHAYECYLRARQEVRRWTEEGLDRALQHYQNGLEIVGDNALLYAGIGSVYWWYVNMGIRTDEEFLDKAEAYAKKVFELEPDSPHGHRLLGLIAIHRGNLRETATRLGKALVINPNDTEALVFLSTTYVYCGRCSAARPLIDRLLEIDPLSPTNYFPLVMCHIMEGRFGEALGPSRKMYRMGSAVPLVGFAHALSLSYNNLVEEAYEVVGRLTQGTPEVYPAHLALLLMRSLQKDRAKAIESISPELKAQAKRDPEIAWMMADCFALIGEKEQSLRWLENAVNRGFVNYPFLSEYDPFLENVRGEEHFRKLMERVKSEWEGFEV